MCSRTAKEGAGLAAPVMDPPQIGPGALWHGAVFRGADGFGVSWCVGQVSVCVSLGGVIQLIVDGNRVGPRGRRTARSVR